MSKSRSGEASIFLKLKTMVVGAVKEFQYKMEPEDSKWKISQMCPLEKKKKRTEIHFL